MSALIAFFMLLTIVMGGHSMDEWKDRTIYQLLTDRFARSDGNNNPCGDLGNYCGGTFRGIINHLDYIQGMGFDAIWISPVIDNTDGGYHGYWARDWNRINDQFGSENDLRELVSECHKRGIWVMVDVVANHVGPVGFDYHSISPFNQGYHYHDYCEIKDWNNQWEVENCRLAGLPDLKQEDNFVQNYLCTWITNLVKNYDFDGLRVDTVPHVPKWFWSKFTGCAGAFTLGEVLNGNLDYLKGYIGPMNSLLNYGLYYQIKDVFKGQSFVGLANKINEVNGAFGNNLKYMGLFVDNHDNARFLNNYGNWDNLVGALMFTLFHPGIPIIYYGDEQGYGGGNDPNNREVLWTNFNTDSSIYQAIKKAVAVRKAEHIWDSPYKDHWHNEHMLAFTRGNVLIVLTNGNVQIEQDVPGLPFSDGTRLCDALSDYKYCITINGGSAHLSIENNKSRVFVKH